MNIKVKLIDKNIKLEQFGNWIDLQTREHIVLNAPVTIKKLSNDTGGLIESVKFDSIFIPLGIAMTLPKWYKAEIKPRSSTFKKYGIIQTNSIGEIEWDYCKEWLFPALAIRECKIPAYERICQFQIKIREDAPWYAKLYDLFKKDFKFVYVDKLTTKRGGIGHTG